MYPQVLFVDADGMDGNDNEMRGENVRKSRAIIMLIWVSGRDGQLWSIHKLLNIADFTNPVFPVNLLIIRSDNKMNSLHVHV